VLQDHKIGAADKASGTTPMMQQYIEIKSVNPDYLLFYRMGDFYELFFSDAQEAARALGITLTKRGKHMGEDIPMCGVPVHAADDYLQRLIALGYRIAVCEQMEDPAEAKKRGSKSVVRRDVVRLVTPGTVTEDNLLDAKSSSWLAVLARTGGQSDRASYALAWVDLSTGAFHVASVSATELAALIARVAPCELVMADTLYHDETIRGRILLDDRAISIETAGFFDSTLGEERMKKSFGLSTLDGIGAFSRAEIAACGAALAYIEKTQISERPALRRPVREAESGFLFVDAATRSSLELIRTQSGERSGSLLWVIDRTITAHGARLLASRLASPLAEVSPIVQRQESVVWFSDQPDAARKVREILSGLPDMTRALSRLALNRGGPRDLKVLCEGLERAHTLAEELKTLELPEELAQGLEAIKTLPPGLCSELARALGKDVPLLARDGGFIAAGYDADLDEQRELRDASRKVIAGLQARYSEETGVKSLKVRHNNVLGYFIEVTAVNATPLMADTLSDGSANPFIHRQTLANAMRFTTTELGEVEARIAQAGSRALELELAHFENLRVHVVECADGISRAAEALAVLDVSQSHQVLAADWNYVRPMMDASTGFWVEDGRHPVVEQVLKRDGKTHFVSNDCFLDSDDDRERIWLLTGPNMGGKSTFLRQNALIIILAQMGAFVPAKSAKIGVVDRLFSRVGAADDLARGRSTFMVEMVETATILNQATRRSFVILDEIGRGTATFDGLSIAWGTVEHLHETNCCRTLFATHYHELTALAEKLEGLANATMEVREWKGDVVFLHSVVPGKADRSYGIQVARLAGLPSAVIERARQVLDQLEDSRARSHDLRIDDLPLFSKLEETADPNSSAGDGLNELAQAMADLEPDEMTPKEALCALYELKAKSLT